MLFGGFVTALGLCEDMGKGLIDRFRSLPTSRASVLAGRVVADLVHQRRLDRSCCSSPASSSASRSTRRRWSSSAGYGLLLLFVFASSWIFAVIGLSVSTPEAANGIGFTIIFPITFISSAFVPVESMPDGLQQVADANPVSTFVDAMRALWLDAPAGDSIWLSVVWAVALIAIFAPWAVSKYRRAAAH